LDSAEPRVSVAMPAYNNGAQLELTLRSLTRQTVPSSAFEVIVVDDGSQPSLAPVARPFVEAGGVTYLRHEPNRGRAVTRNRAVEAARGDVLLFLDSDSCAHPDLVRRHLDFHLDRGDRPGVLMGRRLEIDWAGVDVLRRGAVPDEALVSEYRGDLRDGNLRQPHVRRDLAHAPWLYAFTHNVSVDRASVVAAGGFDRDLVNWGYEDTELFYRVFTLHGRRGDVFDVDQDAICYHLPHFHAWHSNLGHAGRNLDLLFGKHPTYDFEPLMAGLSPLYAIRTIAQWTEALDLCRKHGLAQAGRLPEPAARGVASDACLLVALGTGEIDRSAATVTIDHDRPAGATNLHLAGLRTPFAQRQFDRVVSVDLWRFFGPDIFSLVLLEALRVAGEVELVCTDLSMRAAAMMPVPFIDNIDYLARLVEPHFDVDVRHWPGETASVVVRKGRTE
jgi:glycosyltransferase involved in cell wall biosynthesis